MGRSTDGRSARTCNGSGSLRLGRLLARDTEIPERDSTSAHPLKHAGIFDDYVRRRLRRAGPCDPVIGAGSLWAHSSAGSCVRARRVVVTTGQSEHADVIHGRVAGRRGRRVTFEHKLTRMTMREPWHDDRSVRGFHEDAT